MAGPGAIPGPATFYSVLPCVGVIGRLRGYVGDTRDRARVRRWRREAARRGALIDSSIQFTGTRSPSTTTIGAGVVIEDGVFIGHNVTFINDRYPRATTETGELQTEKDWNGFLAAIKDGRTILFKIYDSILSGAAAR